MSLQSEATCFFEDLANDACSSSLGNIWHVAEDALIGSGENLSYRSQIVKKPCSSFTVVVDIIDDVIGRRGIWRRLFDNSVMPVPNEGNVEKFYGILDDCFPSDTLNGERVLEVLKKAKK